MAPIAEIRAFVRTLAQAPADVEALRESLAAAGKAELLKGLSPSEVRSVLSFLGARRPSDPTTAIGGGAGGLHASNLPDIIAAVPSKATHVPAVPTLEEASAAVAAAEQYLQRVGSSQGLVPLSARGVDYDASQAASDEYGITHVRMQRRMHGIPVYGEQVIAHVKDGQVQSMTGNPEPSGSLFAAPGSITVAQPEVDSDTAVNNAMSDLFARIMTSDLLEESEPELVYYRTPQGDYAVAYHVQVKDFGARSRDGEPSPIDQHYMVDADTGEILRSWNGLYIHQPHAAHATSEHAIEPERIEGEAGLILDHQDLTLTASVEREGMSVGRIKLSIDVQHADPADLTIRLRSPGGVEHEVHKIFKNRNGALRGDIDIRDLFGAEDATGDWELIVHDHAKGDEGFLMSWNLHIEDFNTLAAQQGDRSTFYGNVELPTSQRNDGKFVLKDTSRGVTIETRNAEHTGYEEVAGEFDLTSPITDDNDTWGEVVDHPEQQAGIDAHYASAMMYDFLKDVFDRDSIDGRGMAMNAMVHVDKGFVNAFWYNDTMHYGDGDGRVAGPLTTLDIGGHEISHGVTEKTAALIYDEQSGGLNEASSDILGAGLEWYASKKNDAVTFDWLIGEDTWTPGVPGDGLRDMSNPASDGTSIDNFGEYEDDMDVHHSSGIANNFFYLLVQGGTNPTSGDAVEGLASQGAGDEAAFDRAMLAGLKIWYRALSYYMTPGTTFPEARRATLRAARDIYGPNSVEAKMVGNAWEAVGVERRTRFAVAA